MIPEALAQSSCILYKRSRMMPKSKTGPGANIQQ